MCPGAECTPAHPHRPPSGRRLPRFLRRATMKALSFIVLPSIFIVLPSILIVLPSILTLVSERPRPPSYVKLLSAGMGGGGLDWPRRCAADCSASAVCSAACSAVRSMVCGVVCSAPCSAACSVVCGAQARGTAAPPVGAGGLQLCHHGAMACRGCSDARGAASVRCAGWGWGWGEGEGEG